jgi:hypothetical protein
LSRQGWREGGAGGNRPGTCPQRAEIGPEGLGVGKMLVIAEELEAAGGIRHKVHTRFRG